MLGVIGGMGPLATADFFRKLIDATPAQDDDEHIPVLIHSVPQVPSRPAAILRGGPSPLPALLAARDRLLRAGATLLAMPCNTAHHWYDELAAGCAVPFIHIVDAVADALPAGARELGIVATRATLRARVFERRLGSRGIAFAAPDEATYDRAVQPAIDAVKRGDAQQGGRLLEPVIAAELARGAAAVVLACTELPIALEAIASPLRTGCIDSNEALARACVRRWTDRAA
ncbi:MAG: aspartate/glutamate racemase family protein [Betaproteobacteria bacterium]